MRYTQLALTVIDGSRPHATPAARGAGAAAQHELDTFVADTARRVHQRFGYLRPQRAQDFLAEAPADMAVVLLKHFGAFHDRLSDKPADAARSDDPAAGFLYRAVSNHYVSLSRRRLPGQLGDGAATADGGDAADPFDQMSGDNRRRPGERPGTDRVDDADLLTAPLPAADLDTVRSWRPIDAVVLLLLGHLHRKVDPGQWRAWLGQCGVDGPVPSPATLALPEAKRRDGLAADLGRTRNGLDKIWSVKQHRLRDLRFVERLSRDYPGRAA